MKKVALLLMFCVLGFLSFGQQATRSYYEFPTNVGSFDTASFIRNKSLAAAYDVMKTYSTKEVKRTFHCKCKVSPLPSETGLQYFDSREYPCVIKWKGLFNKGNFMAADYDLYVKTDTGQVIYWKYNTVIIPEGGVSAKGRNKKYLDYFFDSFNADGIAKAIPEDELPAVMLLLVAILEEGDYLASKYETGSNE